MKTQLRSACGRVGSRRRGGGRLGCARDRRDRGGRRASEGGDIVGASRRLLATCRVRGKARQEGGGKGGAGMRSTATGSYRWGRRQARGGLGPGGLSWAQGQWVGWVWFFPIFVS